MTRPYPPDAAADHTPGTAHDESPTVPIPLPLPPPPLPPSRAARGTQPSHRAVTPPPIPPEALRPRPDALPPVAPTTGVVVAARPWLERHGLALLVTNLVLVGFILGIVLGRATGTAQPAHGAVPCAR